MSVQVLFIDNFDSFTFNLVDELARRDATVHVWRNDLEPAHALELALALPSPRLILLSPGPGHPAGAGCCVPLVRLALERRVPLFGVCLGHQAIVEALGGAVGHAGEIVHGKTSAVAHDGRGLFAGLASPLTVGRYHSLVGTRLPASLEVSARLGELVMAVRHREAPLFGVQFHPESILTPQGGRLLENVLACARAHATEATADA